jgi:hypothetical protein
MSRVNNIGPSNVRLLLSHVHLAIRLRIATFSIHSINHWNEGAHYTEFETINLGHSFTLSSRNT